jgi:uncharacterized damage-inducible protein DinB
MKRSRLIVCMLLAGCGTLLQAQTAAESAANPLSSAIRSAYDNVKLNILETAEKVPEDDYSFKPTPEVRTFAEVLNHIAGTQMHICSNVLGSTMSYAAPGANASKANVMAALKASFEECDRAYDSITDATATQMVRSFRGEIPKLAALAMNTNHDSEQYGILTVYMRLKGMVPASTARAMAARQQRGTH